MAKALGGDAPEMYQRKGSSNLLTRRFVSWRGRAAVVSVDRETAKWGSIPSHDSLSNELLFPLRKGLFCAE
jgi:hypothetical protein